MPHTLYFSVSIASITIDSTSTGSGDTIFTIQATDAEGDQLYYEIVSDPTGAPFEVFACKFFYGNKRVFLRNRQETLDEIVLKSISVDTFVLSDVSFFLKIRYVVYFICELYQIGHFQFQKFPLIKFGFTSQNVDNYM